MKVDKSDANRPAIAGAALRYRERWAELLTACPELSKEDIKRLQGYRPRLDRMALCVRLALMDQRIL